MIEKSLLIEQESGDAVLVTLDHTGKLQWVSGDTENVRELAKRESYPNLRWYRVSDGRVHAAANGTEKYRFPLFAGHQGKEDVKRFVENLKRDLTSLYEQQFYSQLTVSLKYLKEHFWRRVA